MNKQADQLYLPQARDKLTYETKSPVAGGHAKTTHELPTIERPVPKQQGEEEEGGVKLFLQLTNFHTGFRYVIQNTKLQRISLILLLNQIKSL